MSSAAVTPIWKAKLRYRTGPTGEPSLVACIENVSQILSNDVDFAGCFARNDLSGETELVRKLPVIVGQLPPRRGPVDSYVLSYTRMALSSVCSLSVGAELAADGIEAAARQRCYNPLHDYLRALTWDGTARLGSWLSAYLGAERTLYTESVGRWWLVSAMARAFRPGCQADHVLVLEGPQGVGKSTALGILGGAWFVAKLPPVRDYAKAAHAMAGAWLVEMGELDAFRGAAGSQIKDFVSLAEDRYQPPYGRFVIRQPRSCIFAGSTNDAHYLRDATGARRFWPVPVGRIDRDALTRDRDQLLAEARVAFEDGAGWWPTADLADELAAQQEARHDTDDWEQVIGSWLAAPSSGLDGCLSDLSQPRDGVTSVDVAKGALGVPAGDLTRDVLTRVGTALQRLGFTPKRLREQGVRVRRYWRVPT